MPATKTQTQTSGSKFETVATWTSCLASLGFGVFALLTVAL